MPNPPGKGHRFSDDLTAHPMTPPSIGAKKMPDVTVTANPWKTSPQKIGSDPAAKTETWANVDDKGAQGQPQTFKSNLPPREQMFDAGGNLKPEIQSEADKASTLSNEPAKVQAQAREESNYPGPNSSDEYNQQDITGSNKKNL